MKGKTTLQIVRNSVQSILKTKHFLDWFDEQDRSTQERVVFRLDRIEIEGRFGFTNFLDGIIELKWKSGLRIYTSILGGNLVVLGGGTKNGQKKDIRRAKKLLKEIKEGGFVPS